MLLTHSTPRYISMPSSSLTEQIIGSTMLEHEMCSLIFRRLYQIDINILYKDTQEVFCHFFEPDFSTHTLADDEITELKSIQE